MCSDVATIHRCSTNVRKVDFLPNDFLTVPFAQNRKDMDSRIDEIFWWLLQHYELHPVVLTDLPNDFLTLQYAQIDIL